MTAAARLFLTTAISATARLARILEATTPDEIYNLAAQSHVAVSFEQPDTPPMSTALGTLRLLEAIRDYQQRTGHAGRFYQAGTSEMFGASPPPQSEPHLSIRVRRTPRPSSTRSGTR